MMSDAEFRLPKRAIRSALARDRYRRSEVRIADPDVSSACWLVASHRGLFAISRTHAKTVVHGWFFGLCRDGDSIYVFENCGARDPEPLGRIVRFELSGGQLRAPAVLATGLHNNCHQIRMIDHHLCLVDTANQAIRRFDGSGRAIDVLRPFPLAAPDSSRGDYLHINSIAKIGTRIALMLHNGKAVPKKQSELAWLGRDWQVEAREPVLGYCCHDIVEDESGTIWHSASLSGEIVGSDGTCIKVTDDLMTRGLAMTPGAIIVGVSTFGPRQVRHTLNGGLVILDRNFTKQVEIPLAAGPTDILAL